MVKSGRSDRECEMKTNGDERLVHLRYIFIKAKTKYCSTEVELSMLALLLWGVDTLLKLFRGDFFAVWSTRAPGRMAT